MKFASTCIYIVVAAWFCWDPKRRAKRTAGCKEKDGDGKKGTNRHGLHSCSCQEGSPGLFALLVI